MTELKAAQSNRRIAPQRMLAQLPVLIALSILALINWGCTGSTTPAETVQPPGAFPVDPVFREYYRHLGGETRMGLAISTSSTEGSATIQYLETGKMVFDPTAPASGRFRLAPLGLEMEVSEPVVAPPSNPQIPFEYGHTILPEFYLLYEQLGVNTVGKPLTEPRYHMIHRRYEQFFENLGFYRLDGDSQVRLLSYGAWVCQDRCNRTPPQEATIDIRSRIDPAFTEFVNSVGVDFTGFALTSAYPRSDGRWEQIFENVVLVTEGAQNTSGVALQPLSEELHILVEEPRPRSGAANMYYYESHTESSRGYEIPLHFWEYIENRGGINRFGPPISHYGLLMKQIYHQCFRYLCLAYDPSASEATRIRPEPLGYAYRVLNYNPQMEAAPATPVRSAPTFPAAPDTEQPQTVKREISLRVWQRYLVMEQKQGQEIAVWVTENGQPVQGRSVDLTLKLPDGAERNFQMPPTDTNGQSNLLLPQIEALNGTIIPFKACYLADADLSVCVADIFVIWDTP